VTQPSTTPAITAVNVTPATTTIRVGMQAWPTVNVTGTGNYDNGWTVASSDASVASVSPDGVVTGVSAGSATITFTSTGDSTKTGTLTVTVNA
jgi:uncharacterized protein YjdB